MKPQISWLTKQGYTAEEIDEVIASEVIQDEAKETATESDKDTNKGKQGHYTFIIIWKVKTKTTIYSSIELEFYNFVKIKAKGVDPQTDQAAQDDIKAAKDAAQAAGAAAKNLFGGLGSALGQAVNKAQPPSAAKVERKDSRKNVSFGDDREKTDSPETPSSVVKPNFVKHINKTRTMSSRQKWDWAFDKILMVSTKDTPIYLATYIVSKLSFMSNS